MRESITQIRYELSKWLLKQDFLLTNATVLQTVAPKDAAAALGAIGVRFKSCTLK